MKNDEDRGKHASGSRKVLCVDADDDSRYLIAESLYEHEVDFALTAEDAVELAHYRSYDLLFVDPAVPGSERLDLWGSLRHFDAGARLVVCSANEVCDAPDADALLRKPLSMVQIRGTALRLLAAP